MVINALGGGHTDTHMHAYRHMNQSNFKKAGVRPKAVHSWFKKEVEIAIKSKETNSQLSSLEIVSYPLYRQHWLLFVSVHENTILAV